MLLTLKMIPQIKTLVRSRDNGYLYASPYLWNSPADGLSRTRNENPPQWYSVPTDPQTEPQRAIMTALREKFDGLGGIPTRPSEYVDTRDSVLWRLIK